ncbi:MAG TPA: hypothetical protein VLH56_11890 [Dissulfurispiraceae bacterium]|nr:hypothetical protein [Dissulfurispiraceae bacterium]
MTRDREIRIQGWIMLGLKVLAGLILIGGAWSVINARLSAMELTQTHLEREVDSKVCRDIHDLTWKTNAREHAEIKATLVRMEGKIDALIQVGAGR